MTGSTIHYICLPQAQAVFDYCYPINGTPQVRLDDGNDGIACEFLP